MRQIAELPLSHYPSQVGIIWRSREDEPETETFSGLPSWMDEEPVDVDFQRDISRVLSEALDTLSKREALILRYRFWSDMTYTEIGKVLGLTSTRILQIEARALRNLMHPFRCVELAPFSQWGEWLKFQDKNDAKSFRRADNNWHRKFLY